MVRDALVSVLNQSYQEFEIILSNNGADSVVRNAIADKLDDPRVRYLEQPEVLPMPEHWERISLLACGRYLTVLTDRSVLKQGALATIAEFHTVGGHEADIVTWSWDVYFTESGFLLPFAGRAQEPTLLESAVLAPDSLRIGKPYPAALPRGLNSSVSTDLIAKIRSRAGVAFSPMSPDFTFAYACLMCHPYVTHLDRALMISQGLSVSNGGIAYLTDGSSYVSTLGLQNPICHSPIKEMFVENLIAEDFFAACHRFERLDILEKIDHADLYLRCLLELDEKRLAAILSPQRIDELAQSIELALANEIPSVKSRVNAFCDRHVSLEARIRRSLKKILGGNLERLRPLLVRLRGGRRYGSILVAAGHRRE